MAILVKPTTKVLVQGITGSFGARGGNLQFAAVPSAPVTGATLRIVTGVNTS